jgi:hypothetical protein
MLRLFTNGHFGMVFEHIHDCFHPEILQVDSHICVNFVFTLHKVTFHVELHVLGTTRLLTMTKPLGGVCPIAMGEELY